MLSVKPARHRSSPSARYHTGSLRVKLRLTFDLRVADRRALTIISCSRGPTPARGGSTRFARSPRPQALLTRSLDRRRLIPSMSAKANQVPGDPCRFIGEFRRCVGSAGDGAMSFLPRCQESAYNSRERRTYSGVHLCCIRSAGLPASARGKPSELRRGST
jgi:hypothetical protein